MKEQPQRHEDTKLESYDYDLPSDRIAQYPVTPRDSSKLMIVSRKGATFDDHIFRELPDLLKSGDVLIINNTRVLPARLQSNAGEVLLVRATTENCWDAMVYPGKHFKPGKEIIFGGTIRATVLSQSPIGRILQFHTDVGALLAEQGAMPLPPYIGRPAESLDRKRYQTIYAKHAGSVAAPTAGLHFSRKVFAALKENGVKIVRITLHVGPGTFRPVKDVDIRHHRIYPEYYKCTRSAWKQIQNAKRVIAVGTTSTRALETIAATGELEGCTDLFIYPGYQFQCIDGLLTNFHLPKSSLLMLVSAFGGYEFIRTAYRHAVQQNYRFYSYGDAMLIV